MVFKRTTRNEALTQDVDPLGEIASDAWLKANINNVTYTSVTRDSNGAATSATVVWPDSTGGTYTATTVSTAFPGAVDAYTLTYAGATTKTVTQAAVTRDSSTGAVTAQPALTVS
jgi:hypothetical protein